MKKLIGILVTMALLALLAFAWVEVGTKTIQEGRRLFKNPVRLWMGQDKKRARRS